MAMDERIRFTRAVKNAREVGRLKSGELHHDLKSYPQKNKEKYAWDAVSAGNQIKEV
jgi:hypothetical protein